MLSSMLISDNKNPVYQKDFTTFSAFIAGGAGS